MIAVLAEEIEVGERAILIICSRILELYEEQVQDHPIRVSMRVEDILVDNYYEGHAPLLRVKVRPGRELPKQEFFLNTLTVVN